MTVVAQPASNASAGKNHIDRAADSCPWNFDSAAATLRRIIHHREERDRGMRRVGGQPGRVARRKVGAAPSAPPHGQSTPAGASGPAPGQAPAGSSGPVTGPGPQCIPVPAGATRRYTARLSPGTSKTGALDCSGDLIFGIDSKRRLATLLATAPGEVIVSGFSDALRTKLDAAFRSGCAAWGYVPAGALHIEAQANWLTETADVTVTAFVAEIPARKIRARNTGATAA